MTDTTIPEIKKTAESKMGKSIEALKQSLKPGQPFSCLVPISMVPLMQQAFASRPTSGAAQPIAPTAADAKRTGRPGAGSKPAAVLPPVRVDGALSTDPMGSVLATTIDIEEPPRDIAGPKIVLVSR